MLHDVRADAALTFDWVFLLLVAAFVAAIGLVENSTVILVASMLISPLMVRRFLYLLTHVGMYLF